ncbi:MAG: hypothetical protein JO232_14355 [Verrucomicrobia bacterium]|nr:hypothetical protein [Verrucomicrobiota bacterium]
MKRKERYIARLDEVKITREGDYAFIEYKEEGVPATHLQIGPEIAAGWGMRIEFVPEDEVHRRPVLEVREPELET